METIHSDGYMKDAYPKRRMFSAVVVEENPEENAQDMTTVRALKKAVSAPTGKLKTKR